MYPDSDEQTGVEETDSEAILNVAKAAMALIASSVSTLQSVEVASKLLHILDLLADRYLATLEDTK